MRGYLRGGGRMHSHTHFASEISSLQATLTGNGFPWLYAQKAGFVDAGLG